VGAHSTPPDLLATLRRFACKGKESRGKEKDRKGRRQEEKTGKKGVRA